jgi:hypothetical protein
MEPALMVARHRGMRTARRTIFVPGLRHGLLPGFLRVLLVLAGLLAACTAGAASTAPSSPASPSLLPSPSLNPFPVNAPDDAAKAVVARVPLFGSILAKDPAMIGASSWYEAARTEAAKPPTDWNVTFTVGWGDCPAGCINVHAWTYRVGYDGTVAFTSETGPQVPPEVIEPLRAAAHVTGLAGRASAGPTCPVERPGDSACGDRSVNGAVLVVKGANGAEVARVTTDASGLFWAGLAAGDYTLTPHPVQGLMGTAAPIPFNVKDGALTYVDVRYDTGIR